MILKEYQKDTLRVLARFFGDARVEGAKQAYETITQDDGITLGGRTQVERLKGFAGPYRPLDELEDVPYVCLRLPTGGGKTLLATHAILQARDHWLEREYPVIVWLVPSKTVRLQTVEALKNPRHAYRKSLDDNFQGRVRVFDMCDFAQVTPSDLRSNLCIFVGTIQTLRVTDTEGRRVYAHHEMLEPHFTKVTRPQGLEINGEGQFAGNIKYSFANLLHLHNPLVIVDEAHNAVTGLTGEMQQRINPSAIVEFTATPRKKSNILHSVSAQELKDEEMIKLPVVLEEHRSWQEAVTGALLKRAELGKIAQRDREGYIRPIVLFQAEAKSKADDSRITADRLRDHLIEKHGLTTDSIAVVTGDQRELDSIDLMSPDCPINYVITVQALKEGWDCPFAYVFCSIANIRSSTDAEQLLGRVLRMPYAQKRKNPALNKAYASLASKHFKDALDGLVEKLTDMGFQDGEARDNIEVVQPDLDATLFDRQRRPKPQTTVTVDAKAEELHEVAAAAPDRVVVSASADGKSTIKLTGFLRKAQKEELLNKAPERLRSRLAKEIDSYEAAHLKDASPAQRDEPFVVPRLMAHLQGELEFADSDVFFEYHDWSLNDHSHQLNENEFSIHQTADAYEIDLDRGKLFVQASDQSQQLDMDVDVDGWSEAGLVQWLDRKVRHAMIGQGELVGWLAAVVAHLTRPRGIPLSALMRCQFVLARVLHEKIKGILETERNRAYQLVLFADEAKPIANVENGFEFFDGMYDGVRYHEGQFRFQKHFTGWDQVPVFDGKGVDGEEGRCAQALDALPEVKYWIRNVAQHPNSFWLPRANGRFYPDFVAKLTDERLLVVEYKGDQYVDGSRAKASRAIGAVWEKASDGRGLFLMAEKQLDGRNVHDQLRDAIRR